MSLNIDIKMIRSVNLSGSMLRLRKSFWISFFDTMTYDVESACVKQQSVGKEKTDKKKQGYSGNLKILLSRSAHGLLRGS